jgi:hypothetical protein
LEIFGRQTGRFSILLPRWQDDNLLSFFFIRDKQVNKEPNRQVDRQTKKQTDKQADRQRSRQIDPKTILRTHFSDSQSKSPPQHKEIVRNVSI